MNPPAIIAPNISVSEDENQEEEKPKKISFRPPPKPVL
jgi:hypothetical protein